MLAYTESPYLPENTVVAIAGNIQHAEAVTAVSQAMGSWRNQQLHPEYSAYKEQPNPCIFLRGLDDLLWLHSLSKK